VDIVWFLLFAAFMGGLWVLAYRMEPHYSSKDGERFLCNGQEIIDGQPIGRKRETRVLVLSDGVLNISQKRRMRRTNERWALIGKSPEPPKGKQIYLLQQFNDGKWLPEQMALHIPSKSRVVPVLDRLLERTAKTR
jgi:hypothetical protein